MAFHRSAFVNLLRDQNGYHEGRDADGNWNNHQKFSPAVPGLEWSQNQAWCATFTAWGADELGARDRWPITASCATAVNWWKQKGRWTEYPVLGGPFYMGTYGQDHVGVVYAYDADWIYTIEGNTNSGGSYQGDGVYERKRPRRGAGSPYGYGVPQFYETTVSADPSLGGIREEFVPRITTPTPPKEVPVALTVTDLKLIANTDGVFPSPDGGENTHWALASYVREGYLRAREASVKAEEVSRKLDSIALAVGRLEGLLKGLELAGVEKAVTDAVTAKLESLHISVED